MNITPQIVSAYITTITVLFFFLMLIWKTDTFPNIILKVILFFAFLEGLLICVGNAAAH